MECLAGYPVVDVKVTLYDGSYHDVDSNEMAFKIAGSMAFKEAVSKAKPVLLEPMMAVEVVTPEDVRGSDHGRPEFAPRTHRRHGTPCGFAGYQVDRPAVGNVRICDAHALFNTGARDY